MRHGKTGILFIAILILPRIACAQEVFSFRGSIDLEKNEFNVVLDLGAESSLSAQAQKTSENDYRFSIDFEHVQTPLFDLLSKIESTVEIVSEDSPAVSGLDDVSLRGKVWSQYSLIDYKPINELSGHFEIKDQRLYLSAISVCKILCAGHIDLTAPHNLDLVLTLDGVAMPDFLGFWSAGEQYASSGAVYGSIRASGTLERTAMKANLQSHSGYVQKLDYDTIVLNIEGIYPNMRIDQSTVSQSDGVSFALKGPFDLSDKMNFRKQIKALTLAPIVSRSGTETEWTIKRLKPQGNGTTELKYRFKRGHELGTRPSMGGNIDMLGIERTEKF